MWGSLVGRTLGGEDYCPGGAKKVEGWTPAGGHRWADVDRMSVGGGHV